MTLLREIHWPNEPQQGDIHTEGGRTWEYTEMPPGSTVPGVWRDVGCKEVTTGPGWTLDDLKEWLGIEGIDQDGAVINAMKICMAYLERYTNRLWEYRENHHERLYLSKGNGWQIHLWPIKGDVYINQAHVDFQIDNQTGILWWPGYSVQPPAEAVYSGGYLPDEWPADVLMVLYNMMKNQWEISGGGGSSLGQDISRITIPDVGTITYANGGSSSANIGMGADFGPLSQADQILLDLYRLHEC
jgi:hypothetical protein